MTTPFVPFLPTLDQLEAMTEQDLFDHSARCLLVQDRPCINVEGICDYSGPDGGHCAIGWLIPEILQNECRSGGGLETLCNHLSTREDDDPKRLRWVLESHEHLFSAMQDAHDNAQGSILPWKIQWTEHLRLAAASLKLNFKVLP
jgi:hypothetical protein